jgi:hypothetical protein
VEFQASIVDSFVILTVGKLQRCRLQKSFLAAVKIESMCDLRVFVREIFSVIA